MLLVGFMVVLVALLAPGSSRRRSKTIVLVVVVLPILIIVSKRYDQTLYGEPAPPEDSIAKAAGDFCCPRCKQNNAESLEILEEGLASCKNCGGHWTSAEGLLRIFTAYESNDPEPSWMLPANESIASNRGEVRYHKCPVCVGVMNRRLSSTQKFVVDVCELHGIWFDPGELSTTVRLVRDRKAIFSPEIRQQKLDILGAIMTGRRYVAIIHGIDNFLL